LPEQKRELRLVSLTALTIPRDSLAFSSPPSESQSESTSDTGYRDTPAEWSCSLIVIGLCLLVMLAMFPTRNRVRNWLDKQTMAVQDIRNAGV